MMSDYKVEMVSDGMKEFFAEFKGPAESNNPHAESRFLPSLCLRADDPRSCVCVRCNLLILLSLPFP
jgi:hypothetical protein